MDVIQFPPHKLTVEELTRYNWRLIGAVIGVMMGAAGLILGFVFFFLYGNVVISVGVAVTFTLLGTLGMRYREYPKMVKAADKGRGLLERDLRLTLEGLGLELPDGTKAFVPWSAYNTWQWLDGDLFVRSGRRQFLLVPSRVMNAERRKRTAEFLSATSLVHLEDR